MDARNDFVALAAALAQGIAESRGKEAGGVRDLRALAKYRAELGELMDDLKAGRFFHAITEAPDGLYYAGKAALAGLVSHDQALAMALEVISIANAYGLEITFAQALDLMRAKYQTRIENNRLGITKTPEGNRREALACLHALQGRPVLAPPTCSHPKEARQDGVCLLCGKQAP